MKKTVLAVVVAVAVSWIFSSMSIAKPEFAKKEGNKPCTTCHEAGKFNKDGLNATGKCYGEKKDLKACEKK